MNSYTFSKEKSNTKVVIKLRQSSDEIIWKKPISGRNGPGHMVRKETMCF